MAQPRSFEGPINPGTGLALTSSRNKKKPRIQKSVASGANFGLINKLGDSMKKALVAILLTASCAAQADVEVFALHGGYRPVTSVHMDGKGLVIRTNQYSEMVNGCEISREVVEKSGMTLDGLMSLIIQGKNSKKTKISIGCRGEKGNLITGLKQAEFVEISTSID